ncbi:MAG: PKD domain-containing protein [Ferruginibacter sp.]
MIFYNGVPFFKKTKLLFYSFTAWLVFASVNTGLAQPTISSFTPASTICEGESISITGTNFTNVTAVKINNTTVTYVVNNATTITATAAVANGKISVTTDKGTASSTGSINVLPAPVPGLTDQSNLSDPFTNCNGNSTYQLKVSNNSVCAGGAPCNYEIDWGDNSPKFTQADWSTGAQTNHTYNNQGYFNITISITPSNGCKKSKTYKFYNGTNPLASLTTTTSTTGLCAPASIEFQIGNWFNNSAGTYYQVDFGDGTLDVVLQHPLNASNIIQKLSHNYVRSSCPGSPDFTATLNAINGCFTTTYTLNQIVIREKPKVDFSILPNPACIDDPVCFDNLTIGGFSGNSCSSISNYTWDFGDNTSSSQMNPNCHTYAATGTYTVTLSANNAACGSDSKSKTVTVKPVTPVPTVTSPVKYCVGDPASSLKATGTGLIWYTSASGGFGSSIAPVPSTNFPGTTIYYVSQTGGSGGCESKRVPITVTVTGRPAEPVVNSPVSLCQNQAASPLTATGTGLLWYNSLTGGTGSATAPTPSTATINTYTYFVSQTVNGCEGPRETVIVNVNSFPAAPVVVSPVTYCQNQPAAALTATGTSLKWYTVATGGTGTSTAPIPSTSTVGSIKYYVSQVSGCGESPRAEIEVVVKSSPSATISYSQVTLCNVVNSGTTPNPPVNVALTGTTGGFYTVLPATGLPVNSSTGQLDPSGATPGRYTITYTVGGGSGCADFSTSTVVNVNGTPAASILYSTPMCSSDQIKNVQLTGSTGGEFTSTTGLDIDKTTGAVKPASSTPGSYVVTYTIKALSPCPGFTTQTNITITKIATAAISYTPFNLCNVSNTASTPNPPVGVSLTGTDGGIFSITPLSGLALNNVTGEIAPAGAVPGTYFVKYTIPATGGCQDVVSTATINVNGTPTATMNYPGSPYCQGISSPQPVTLTGTFGGSFSEATGKLSVNASTGEINPSLSVPGNYTVAYAILPSPPCPGFETKTNITISESPVISFPVAARTICSGGTATFSPASTVSNTTYNWAVKGALPAGVTGQTSGTASGVTKDIIVSFANSTQNSETITIAVLPTNPAQNPCDGAAYNLTVTVNPVPLAPLVSDTVNRCMGTPAAALTATGAAGNTLNWYDANNLALTAAPVISTAVPAKFIHYVSQTNIYHCESPQSKIITMVNPTPKIVGSSFTNPTTCGVPSGTISLNVLDLNDNGIPGMPVIVTYEKFQSVYSVFDSTDASGKITVQLPGGTYSNIYVETKGCASQKLPDVFVLKDPNPPAKPVVGYNPPVCSENILNLSASSPTSSQTGPIDYIWVGPAFGPLADTSRNTVMSFPSASMSYAGTYIVYAMQNNCISEQASFLVTIKQSPSKPQITTRAPLCIGDNLILQATSSMPGQNATLNYTWTGPGRGFPVNQPNAQINNVIIADGGRYAVTVNSPQTGCSSFADTLIGIGGYPVVDFEQHSFILPTGYQLKLEPQIKNASQPNILPMKIFEWDPAANINCNDDVCATPVATVKTDGCITLKATNIYGCSGTDTICIKVFCNNTQVFIPNAFTPQGGLPENSRFMVRATGIASVKSLRVFSRWGQVVFEKNNFPPNVPDMGWDGRVNGKLADPAVYIYTVEVVCDNGIPYTYKGNVTLLK